MPLTYRIENGRLTFRLEGEYDFEETRPTFLEALNGSRIAPEIPVLFDARDASGHPPPRVLRQAAALLRPYQKGLGPFAVVVSDPLHFGLTRMFQAFAGDTLRIEVFYDVEDAEAWLAGEARLDGEASP